MIDGRVINIPESPIIKIEYVEENSVFIENLLARVSVFTVCSGEAVIERDNAFVLEHTNNKYIVAEEETDWYIDTMKKFLLYDDTESFVTYDDTSRILIFYFANGEKIEVCGNMMTAHSEWDSIDVVYKFRDRCKSRYEAITSEEASEHGYYAYLRIAGKAYIEKLISYLEQGIERDCCYSTVIEGINRSISFHKNYLNNMISEE